jgi:hypothetical protein
MRKTIKTLILGSLVFAVGAAFAGDPQCPHCSPNALVSLLSKVTIVQGTDTGADVKTA